MKKNQENNEKKLSEQIWKEYEPKIRKICEYKLTSYPDEIDEVVSQTFLALCIKLSEDKIDNPKAWLYSTANNLIKMTYEAQNRNKRKLISLDLVVADINQMHNLIYTKDFLDKELSNDQIDILKAQVEAELDYDELALLNLVNDKQLRYKEIAEMMNSTENAVKQRSYRLRGKIKEIAKEKVKNFKKL